MKKIVKYLIIVFACVFSFFAINNINTKAWSIDTNGNLKSDNLIYLKDNYVGTINGVNYEFENDFLNLNGTTNGNGFYLDLSDNFTSVYKIGKKYNLISNIKYDNSKLNYSVNLIYDDGKVDYIYPGNSITLNKLPISSKLALWVEPNLELNIENMYFVLYEGNKTIYEYEPYGKLYYSETNKNNYGSTKFTEGYNQAKNSVANIANNKYNTIACLNNDIECILDNTYNEGINSVDITSDNEQAINDYIQENNYHSNEEYLNYGTTKKNEGYNQASEEGKQLGNFVPSLLGGIGSFFLTIMNIDILGFNLLSVLGIIIAVASIIVVIKFLKG